MEAVRRVNKKFANYSRTAFIPVGASGCGRRMVQEQDELYRLFNQPDVPSFGLGATVFNKGIGTSPKVGGGGAVELRSHLE